jgi:ABC-type amino acid transport substrate-binding protein
VTGIQASRWDLAPAGITDSRSEVATPTKPFAKVDYTMLVKDKSAAKSWREVDQPGKRISVSQGSNTDQALTKVIKQAAIVRVHQEQALLEVLGDKVDAQAVQKDYAMQAIKKYPGLRTVSDAFGRASSAGACRRADDGRPRRNGRRRQEARCRPAAPREMATRGAEPA